MNKDITFGNISTTYIGAVIGAGFASGQEILQFFAIYGYKGFFGLIISTILFIFFGYTILYLANILNAKSYSRIVKYVCGKRLGVVIDIITTIFLFAVFSAMIAGSGAIFSEQFNQPAIIGMLLMSLLTLFTVIKGLNGIINSLNVIVPYLIISMVIISIYIIAKKPVINLTLETTYQIKGFSKNWFISAINYVSYNLILSVAILTSLGNRAMNKRHIALGAILGGIGLGIVAIVIYLALLINITEIFSFEIPMVVLANDISPLVKVFYCIILFIGIYSTAVGNLYGFVVRITKRKNNIFIIILTTVCALIVSQLGFSNMVKYLYPFIGYGGLFLFAGLLRIYMLKLLELTDLI